LPRRWALVGRQGDLARIVGAVAAGERLLTVLGPPGIGKTSLATRAAEILAPSFAGASGACFVDLSSAVGEADLCFAVLSALSGGAQGMPAATPANVALLLEERGPTLMVLDNVEQLVSAAGLVHAWWRGAPELLLLVTSRERLAVEGEHVIELLPLACPPAGAAREEILASDAVQLFQARARDAGARPSEDLEAVAAIVRRLDGIPLAIELAAARTRVLSPAELSARLWRGEDVLGAATKRSHERHRTLSHAIAWSWGLLTPDEQLALACCAVFPASFGVASAERLVDAGIEAERAARRSGPGFEGATPATPAVDLLAALREKSLVHATEDDRLALYLSIREFAKRRLDELPAADAVRLAHARAFADLALRFNTSRMLLDRTPDPSLHAALRRETPDLVAALAHASTLPPEHAALRAQLAAAVAFLGAMPAELVDGELTALLAAPELLTTAELATVLVARQSSLNTAGRFEESLAHAARAAALPGVSPGIAGFAVLNAGVLLRVRGDMLGAWEYHEQAARLLGDEGAFPRLAGINTACMGRLQGDLSHPERARALNTLAIELCDRLGDRWLAGLGLANHAQLEQEEGNFERAEDLLTRALARFRETGEPHYEAIYAGICGGLFLEWGKHEAAREQFARGEATLASLTQPFARVLLHGGRAALEALTGHPEGAAAHLELCRRYAARSPSPVAKLIVELHAGTVELARAPVAAGPAWARRVDDLARGDAPDATLVRCNIDVRFALRILVRARATLCPEPAGAVLRLSADATAFSLDGRAPVDLARRGALRRILAALCEERLAHRGRTMPLEALTARGWPQERILVEAAATRVRVAIATLRKLGLRDVLLTRDDGYLIDPAVRVEIS
jgi:predicted ATPase